MNSSPADPGHEVAGPDVRVAGAAATCDEQLVTVGVPEGVVDELEPVEVEEQQGHVGVVDRRPAARTVREVLVHHAAVGEAGQAVVHGLVGHAGLGALGDVEGLDDPERRGQGRGG